MRSLTQGALLLVCSAGVLPAQSPLSKIVGTVGDARAGLVAGGSVSVRNDGNGYSRSAVTDDTGYYELDKLPDGPYTVRVSMPGFKQYEQREIILETRQTMRIDVSLEIGDLTQHVEVSGEAPVVSTDTGMISSGQGNRKFIDNNYLPTITNLYVAYGSYLSPSIQQYETVGTTAAQNITTVEGVDTHGTGIYFNAESIQEVKIVTSGNTAEYANPMVMDWVLQSGTNQLHAKILFQLGNPALNALGPSTTKRGPGWPTSRDQLWSASGPVRIPKIYNGTNKTFFYVDRYWKNQTGFTQGASPVQIPPEAMRTGDFSFLPGAIFKTGALIDPPSGLPFPNNQIPAQRISAVSANITKFVPATNYPSLPRSCRKQRSGRKQQLWESGDGRSAADPVRAESTVLIRS